MCIAGRVLVVKILRTQIAALNERSHATGFHGFEGFVLRALRRALAAETHMAAKRTAVITNLQCVCLISYMLGHNYYLCVPYHGWRILTFLSELQNGSTANDDLQSCKDHEAKVLPLRIPMGTVLND